MDRDGGTENILKGKWMQVRGQAQTWWGQLTDDDLDRINGEREKLAGKLRERYGWSQQEAEQEVDRFERELKTPV